MIALLVAMALTVAMYVARDRLLFEHNRISNRLVELSGVPITGSARINLFPPIGSTEVSVPDTFHFKNDPLRVAILFVGSVIGLLAVHRRVQLARNFVVFLGILLMIATGVMVFSQTFEVQSAEFTQIWLREEVLVWLVLPWFSAGLFVLVQPNVWSGLLWALIVQVYGFVWSAVRLAFCLAVIHYSGLLFMPLLWFGFGLLADNIYLLVFFSLSTHQSVAQAWGRRLSWQF